METISKFAIGVLVSTAGACAVIAVACSSSSSNTIHELPPGMDATMANPQYCENLCTSEQSSGTLVGTFGQCIQDCCLENPTGCTSTDSGRVGSDSGSDQNTNPPVDSGGTDSAMGQDGSTENDGSGNDGATEHDSGGEDAGHDAGCATPCNGHCCASGDICANNACIQSCTKPSDCPLLAPCCAVQSNGQSGCEATAANQQCRCVTASDCSATGCCAPLTNAGGTPVGPYVCKPNDANAYDCCYGVFNDCSGNYCCISDSNNNEFCALPCTTNTMCTPAHCDPFDFGDTTTCSGSTACGP